MDFPRRLFLVFLHGCLLAFTGISAAHAAPTTATRIVVGGANPAWGIPDRNATSPFERARRRVFDEFSRQHPEIELQRYTSLRIQGPAEESGIIMAFGGGTAPDIVYVNFRQLRNYVQQDFLRPLNDLIAQNPNVMDRVQPRVKEVLDVNGQIYSIPWAQYVQALYYRKDLFRAAGLNPNQPPRTWDEFYHDAQTLTVPEKGQFGFAFPQAGPSYWWMNFLWQAGGEVAVKNDKGVYLAAFNSTAGATAVDFYRKLLLAPWNRNGKTYKGVATLTTTLRQDISAGKVGMWFAYQSEDITNMNQYDLNPSLLGIAAMPIGPTGKTGNEINSGMWGINAAVKDPQKIAACWTFIRFMASEEASQIRTQAFVENGLGTLVNPVELHRFGYDEYITNSQRPWLDAQKTLFANGKPEPSGPSMQFIYQLMNEPLERAILYPDRPAIGLLNDAAGKINTKLLSQGPSPQKRWIAWTIFALLATTLLGGLGGVVARGLRQTRRRTRAPATRLPLQVHVSAWAFMAPAIASVLVWAYLPLLRGLIMAFQDYRILGGSKWIGLDNFIEAFEQETFRIGMWNAVEFTLWLLGIGFLLPVVVALLLNEIPKGKVFFRVLYYLPAVTTSVVVAMLWKQFWDPAPTGLANTVLSWFHFPALKWLQDPSLAKFAVVLPLVWAGAGPGSIIYLAAMQSIPDEMYEAADLDGAGFFQKIFQITIPTLTPLILINLVGATIGAFKIMEPILVQTGGGPDNATYTIGLEVWYNAFMYLKFGYATAAAILMALILIGLTMYQLRVLQNVRFAGGSR